MSPAVVLQGARAHLRDPLYRNAYALMASTIATSALGVAFWVAAARLYSPEVVGRDTALILAMQGLALVGQLNLGTAMVRFLPQIRRGARRGVAAVYVVAATSVLLLTAAFVIGAPRISDQFSFIAGDESLSAGYVVAVALWVVFVLQDAVLTALRRTGWVPIENTVFGVLKLIALVALAGGAAGHGILVAWIVPAALIVPAVTWLLFRHLLPQHAAMHREGPSPVEAHGRRKLLRFLGQDYLGSVVGQAGMLCLPLVVVGILGSRENAYFAIPFALAMTFDLLFYNGATSLTVEGANDEGAIRDLTLRLVRRVFGPLGIIAVAAAAAAPLLLWPFGPDYVREGTSVLRLLLLAGLFRATIFVFIAVMRLRRQSGPIMAAEGTLFVVLFALTLTLAPRLGREGVGLAWLTANGIVALSVAPWLARFLRTGLAESGQDAPAAPAVRAAPSQPERARFGRRSAGDTVARASSSARNRPAGPVVALAAASCVAAPVAVLAGAPGVVRMVLVLALLLFAPGTVLVGWLRPDGISAPLGLIVGASLAVTCVTAQAMLSLGLWWPRAALCAVGAVCLPPLAHQLRSGRAVRRALPVLADVAAQTISVVVPSGVSGAALRATLRSILAADADEVQVVVVDRDPATATAAEVVAGLADARLLYTCAPGATLRMARERGTEIATGDIVAFAVPDTIVHEGWLEALIAPFSRPRVGCVVGRLPERDAARREEALRARPAGEVIDLLWDGDRDPVVSFAVRAGTTPHEAGVVAYAPGALAWAQVAGRPELVVA